MQISDINAIGPMLLGGVVGWMIYYFIRRFSTFSPQALGATFAAFAGGPLLKYIGGFEHYSQSYYLAGVGIGFFIYALFLAVLLYLLGIGRIDDSEFAFFAGCGGVSPSEIRFSRVMTAYKDWSKGKISNLAFEIALKTSGLTAKEYAEISSSQLEFASEEGVKIVEEFNKAGLPEKLKKSRRAIKKNEPDKQV
ncbi:hypothetical protein [Methylobacterium sp. Leaf85]|uniref:hypothetical protein n=1 Tax=Methylobacterium sp. Leaf85 TaxID=1736241 RepID=UPI001AEC2DA3|nr:hypothetical protein [Methylobacterium sp. Leaf85]